MRSFDMGEIPALLYFKPGTQLFVRRLNMSGARCRATLRPCTPGMAYRLAWPTDSLCPAGTTQHS